MRVDELAKKLGVDARILLLALDEMGEVAEASHVLGEQVVRELLEHPRIPTHRYHPFVALPAEVGTIPRTRVERTRGTQPPKKEGPAASDSSSASPLGKDLPAPEAQRMVQKALSRISRAESHAAQLERCIRLGARSPYSRMDAEVTRDKLLRDMQRSAQLRAPASEEDLKTQVLEVRRHAREVEARLRNLSFTSLPALRPALSKTAKEQRRDVPQIVPKKSRKQKKKKSSGEEAKREAPYKRGTFTNSGRVRLRGG